MHSSRVEDPTVRGRQIPRRLGHSVHGRSRVVTRYRGSSRRPLIDDYHSCIALLCHLLGTSTVHGKRLTTSTINRPGQDFGSNERTRPRIRKLSKDSITHTGKTRKTTGTQPSHKNQMGHVSLNGPQGLFYPRCGPINLPRDDRSSGWGWGWRTRDEKSRKRK